MFASKLKFFFYQNLDFVLGKGYNDAQAKAKAKAAPKTAAGAQHRFPVGYNRATFSGCRKLNFWNFHNLKVSWPNRQFSFLISLQISKIVKCFSGFKFCIPKIILTSGPNPSNQAGQTEQDAKKEQPDNDAADKGKGDGKGNDKGNTQSYSMGSNQNLWFN